MQRKSSSRKSFPPLAEILSEQQLPSSRQLQQEPANSYQPWIDEQSRLVVGVDTLKEHRTNMKCCMYRINAKHWHQCYQPPAQRHKPRNLDSLKSIHSRSNESTTQSTKLIPCIRSYQISVCFGGWCMHCQDRVLVHTV